jgi:hypothetical protein
VAEGPYPSRPNGAEIIAYYANREPDEPDEEFAAILEEVHEEMNRPVMAEDPWEIEADNGVFDVDPEIQTMFYGHE